jgi:hypothetical protein
VAARVRVQREGLGLLFVVRRRYLGVRAWSRGGRRRSRRGGRYAGEERGEEEEALTRGARRSEGDGGELERASALGLREKGGPGRGPRERRRGREGGARAWPTREGGERGERGKEMGREKSRPTGFGCFPSFPFLFLSSNIQTKPFEFKCKLNSNL